MSDKKYDDNNKIAIFPSSKRDKEGNVNMDRPDWTGTATINNEVMDVSLWIREPGKDAKVSKRFLSGEIKPRPVKGAEGTVSAAESVLD